MSEFLTYKKISDLEEITEVTDGATIPVLDGDGVMKRISAAGIGNGNGNDNGNGNSGGTAAPIIFEESEVLRYYNEPGSWARVEDIVDAYFAGNAYIGMTQYNVYCPQKIVGFSISNDRIYANAVQGAAMAGFQISCNGSDLANAITKHLP